MQLGNLGSTSQGDRYLMRFDIQHEAAQYVADVVALIAINFHYHLYRSGSLVEHGPIVVHRTRYLWYR